VTAAATESSSPGELAISAAYAAPVELGDPALCQPFWFRWRQFPIRKGAFQIVDTTALCGGEELCEKK
jgi:hypothetical protein